MKTKLFITALMAFLFLGFAQQATAQKGSAAFNDTLPPWFKAPVKIIGADDMLNGNGSFMLPAATRKAAKPISASMAKSMKLPRAVKRLPSPITVKRGDNCYRIGCDDRSCKNCQLLWLDKNKDGKVQPRKELRCVCLDSRKPCQIRGKKVPCRK